MGDGVELPDRLQFVAEEVEAVGLVGCDGIEVDNAAADRVVAGRLAHGFGIVIEFLELCEEALKRLLLSTGEREFAGGEFLEGGDGLQQRGGRRHDDHGVGCRGHAADRAQAREHGEAVTRSGEGFAHVAVVGHRLGENERAVRPGIAGSCVEKREVLGDVLSGFQVLGDHEPHGRGLGAGQLGDDGAPGGWADAGELGAREGRDGHKSKFKIEETRNGKSRFVVSSRRQNDFDAPSVASAARAADSSASFFDVPRPVPTRRSKRKTATSYSGAWSSPAMPMTS